MTNYIQATDRDLNKLYENFDVHFQGSKTTIAGNLDITELERMLKTTLNFQKLFNNAKSLELPMSKDPRFEKASFESSILNNGFSSLIDLLKTSVDDNIVHINKNIGRIQKKLESEVTHSHAKKEIILLTCYEALIEHKTKTEKLTKEQLDQFNQQREMLAKLKAKYENFL